MGGGGTDRKWRARALGRYWEEGSSIGASWGLTEQDPSTPVSHADMW